jgi:subtilisin family serine protease
MRRGAKLAGFLAMIAALPSMAAAGPAPSRCGPWLARDWPQLDAEAAIMVWVFLDAKPAELAPIELGERARARLRRAGAPPSQHDQPVAPADVSAIAALVTRVRMQSRWLNAVSVEATPEQIASLARLPRVRALERVAVSNGPTATMEVRASRTRPQQPAPTGIDYGPSYDQLQMLQVPDLHALGLTGRGVMVAHFDAGYDLLAHTCFNGTRIVATWDFVEQETDVAVDPRDGDDGSQGIYTLSVLAGNRPGALVGAAYGASYALARTERSSVETASEEDLWIAGLEWADALGADIVSSSLRFLQNNVPAGSGYTWRDMNGNTALVTRAANLAAQRGMLVVNGAGNEGLQRYRNTLVAPADGEHVLAVGAVGFEGTRVNFSSVGPTTDKPPRRKPDVMAPGQFVYAADPLDFDSYTEVSGTSLSTPLVAGVVALLLEAYPEATPLQIVAAIRATASHSNAPNREMGWGIVRGMSAYHRVPAITAAANPRSPRFSLVLPNPWRSTDSVHYALPTAAAVTLRVYDVRGRSVRTLVDTTQPARAHAIAWDGTDDAGRALASGTYFVRLQATPAGSPRLDAVRKIAVVR